LALHSGEIVGAKIVHVSRWQWPEQRAKPGQSDSIEIKFSNRQKVTAWMEKFSLDSLDYRILSAAEAIVESFNEDSAPTVFIRNFIAFLGNRLRIAHLKTHGVIKTIIIPYSLHTIFRPKGFLSIALESLVFEFGANCGRLLGQLLKDRKSNLFFSLDLSVFLVLLSFAVVTLFCAFTLNGILPSGD
jgi:hypothetical protein